MRLDALSQNILFRALRVARAEGARGLASRIRRWPSERKWRALDMRTERLTEVVKRHLAPGRDLYDGMDERLRQELIWIKDQQAVNFHRRSFLRHGLTEAHVRSYFARVLGYLAVDEEIFRDRVVLEVGSGPMGMLNYCPAREVVNLDPCIDEYKKYVRNFPHLFDRISFVNAYAEDMPLESGRFDIVVCVNALDHFNDVRASLREIHRVLRNDGLFLLSVDCKDRTIFTRAVKNIGHPHSFTPAKLRALVAQMFEIVYEKSMTDVSQVTMRLRKRAGPRLVTE